MTDSDNIVVSVNNLYKTFKLPHEQSSGIKQALVNKFKGKKGYEVQEVLKDISFEIKEGEFFGIVGRNGSGKSTLLKLLAGIYSPDSGSVRTVGSLTPFIELGVGFNPELTGRENVFLNGALLGFSKQEMEEMYGDIVDFAEIEKFMDQKLKNYSSGMQVRLAFSIAIRANSNILILDEVLAVGDEAFQRKCISVFEQYKARKQTIILVTHDMGVVERFCSRALMLEDGKVVDIGSPREVAERYSRANTDDYVKGLEKKYSENFKIKTFDPATGKPATQFNTGDKMLVRLDWERDDVENAGVTIMKQSGEYVFGPNTSNDKFKLKKGAHSVEYLVDLDVNTGEYFIKAGLFGKTDSEMYEFIDQGPTLLVENKASKAWGGIAYLPHSWKE
ncbi:MAG TPA: ABC transporter ATP-binding protein [Candidatus Microsaccharimonas sp.]|jgi:ABC-type polysaccharide/polyol phosphate transport system ATPase subunit